MTGCGGALEVVVELGEQRILLREVTRGQDV